jgi:ribosomal protein S18 acetylase RimI-like enzyme
MNTSIKIKLLTHTDLSLYFIDFYILFSENTRGHEIKREIPESYIKQKVNELFSFLKSDNAFLLGAVHEEVLIGFLWAYKRVFFEEQRIYINSMIINETHRGNNVGKSLMKELEKIALANNISVLDVSTASFKQEAIKFYESLGFKSERIQFRKELK